MDVTKPSKDLPKTSSYGTHSAPMQNRKLVITIILLLALIPLGWWLTRHLSINPASPIMACFEGFPCEATYFSVGQHHVEITPQAINPGDNGPVDVSISIDGRMQAPLSSQFNYDTLMNVSPVYTSWWWIDGDLKLDLLISVRTPYGNDLRYTITSQDGALERFGRPEKSNDDEKICLIAKNFYEKYLTDLDRETTVINSKEDLYNLYKSYLTPACANEVWRIVTTEHYEPILQAQDWSPDWRQYLQATPLPQSSGGRACRVVIDPNWNQTIIVKLVHVGDKYFISEFGKGTAVQ